MKLSIHVYACIDTYAQTYTLRVQTKFSKIWFVGEIVAQFFYNVFVKINM